MHQHECSGRGLTTGYKSLMQETRIIPVKVDAGFASGIVKNALTAALDEALADKTLLSIGANFAPPLPAGTKLNRCIGRQDGNDFALSARLFTHIDIRSDCRRSFGFAPRQ